jgi:hypothetical protein
MPRPHAALAFGPCTDRGRASSQGAAHPEGTLEVPHAPVEHPHSPVAYRAVSGGPSPALPVAHTGRGLGPRARLGSRGRAAGGLCTHIWGGSLPRRSGPRHITSWPAAASSSPSRPPPSTTTSLATTTNPQDSCLYLADPQSSLCH